VDVAAITALDGDGDPVAVVAFYGNCKNVVLVLEKSGGFESEVFFADVLCGEDGDEGNGASGLLDGRAAVSLLAFDEAGDGDDVETELLGGFNGLDSGGSGGANVIDDDDLGAFFAEAFDSLGHAMLLLGLADQEAVDESVTGGFAMALLSTESSDGDDDGVGAHGEATDSLGVPAASANLVEENASGKLGAVGMKGRGSAVDVVIACAAAGELEFP